MPPWWRWRSSAGWSHAPAPSATAWCCGDDLMVDEEATAALREKLRAARGEVKLFDRGGTVEELRERCLEEDRARPAQAAGVSTAACCASCRSEKPRPPRQVRRPSKEQAPPPHPGPLRPQGRRGRTGLRCLRFCSAPLRPPSCPDLFRASRSARSVERRANTWMAGDKPGHDVARPRTRSARRASTRAERTMQRATSSMHTNFSIRALVSNPGSASTRSLPLMGCTPLPTWQKILFAVVK